MKKFFILSALFLIFMQTQIFSQQSSVQEEPSAPPVMTDVDYPKVKNGTIFNNTSFVQLDTGVCFLEEYGPSHVYVQTDFFLDGGNGSAEVRARAAYKTFDFATRITFWPLLGTYVRFGVGGLYSLGYNVGDVMVNSFDLSLHFEVRTASFFSMKLDFGYVGVFTENSSKSLVFNQSYGAALEFSFILPKNLGFDLRFATYDLINVRTFDIPGISIDVHYKMNKNWQFGLEIYGKFIDIHTFPDGTYDFDVKARARYLFQ